MKILYKPFNLFLIFALMFSPLGAIAQQQRNPAFSTARPNQAFVSPYNPFIKKTPEQQLMEELRKAALERPADLTVQKLEESLQKEGGVDLCAYNKLIRDGKYIESLSEDEVIFLIDMASNTHFEERKGCRNSFIFFLKEKLNQDISTSESVNALNGLYVLIAASYARKGISSYNEISQIAFEVLDPADVFATRERGWAVELLFYLAQVSDRGYTMPDWEREFFEEKIAQKILRMDYLKDMRADYYASKRIKGSNVLSTTNQGALISLFIQTNHVLSMKNDDPLLKQMFSTGGFNALVRGETPGFSSRGETFYIHHITPGTDGDGNMAPTLNGYRHAILANLIQVLFASYHTRSREESSEKMKTFIRRYFKVDSEGEFKNYLYVPLIGMRVATIYHEDSSLYGWEREERALQDELYSLLKDGYPWSIVCSSVQGSCEVAAEWLAGGKIFGSIFKALGWGVKAAGGQLVKVLPRSVLAKWISARAARRVAVQWTKENIGVALKDYGWKAAIAAGTAAAVTSDTKGDNFYKY